MYCAPVQGVPALADLTSRCSISPVYYETFGVEFQRRDRLVDFFDSIDRRDPTLSARFADCGLTGDNMASVAAFLNALALIGLRSAPGAVDTAEMRTTTLAAVFAAFLMNGTTAADPDAFTEKYTGAGRIADLKRWRRYWGAETVPWPVPLSVRGQRDFQADTFRNPFNLQLNLFTPITRRLETWRADDQAVDLAGLSLIRFRPRPETWASATDWVGNARWAMYGPSGVVGLDPGATGVPIYVSQAHFLDADPVLSASLTGLQPDRAQHQSFVDFEPNLGAALRARLRFQVNLRLDRGMVADPLLVRAEHAYLPLWWMEVGGDGPDPDAARRLRTGLAGAVQLCFIVRLLLSMAALPLFCYGVGLARASITAWRKA